MVEIDKQDEDELNRRLVFDSLNTIQKIVPEFRPLFNIISIVNEVIANNHSQSKELIMHFL